VARQPPVGATSLRSRLRHAVISASASSADLAIGADDQDLRHARSNQLAPGLAKAATACSSCARSCAAQLHADARLALAPGKKPTT
jgi:hypothetical protein